MRGTTSLATAAGQPSPAAAKDQRINRNFRELKERRLLAIGSGSGVMVWPAVTSAQTYRAPKTPKPD